MQRASAIPELQYPGTKTFRSAIARTHLIGQAGSKFKRAGGATVVSPAPRRGEEDEKEPLSPVGAPQTDFGSVGSNSLPLPRDTTGSPETTAAGGLWCGTVYLNLAILTTLLRP